MTLDQLRIFAEVAAQQHITHAAAALNMTQSAVSAAISALENRYDVRLFDRVGRSIVLNAAGRVFLKEALNVLGQVKIAQSTLTDLSGTLQGTLSIMASQTIGSYWLPERLAVYRRTYPGVALELRIGNTAEVSEAVSAGHVEIGLIEWTSNARNLQTSVIDTDEMIVIVAPDHPWADGKAREPQDFPQTDWILREPGSGTRLAFEKMIDDAGVDLSSLTVALVMPENEAAIGAVLAGMGATLLSRSVVRALLDSNRVVEANIRPVPRPFFLLRHSERYHSKAADAFEALVAKAAG